MRKLIYISGTRADYGLMARSLKLWNDSSVLEVSVCVTGMHLLKSYGYTIQEIEKDGLRVCAKVAVDLSNTSGAVMAKGIATALTGMVDVFMREQPDLVVALGDRGEMLAAALAAIHLNIPIVHIHGGERSGTIDEPVRHAISKLSHYHFTATDGARERLVKMGECPDHVFMVGAPGLDGLLEAAIYSRDELCEEAGFGGDEPIALLLFHPVVQNADEAGEQMRKVLQALEGMDLQILCLMPNADAGGEAIRQAISSAENKNGLKMRVEMHLPRTRFVSWMKHADIMVGNSSSGIIEAATFGTPVVNIGNRQHGRERNLNVLDVPVETGKVRAALVHGLNREKTRSNNIYGDGKSGERMLQLLKSFPLNKALLHKINAY